MSTYDPVNNPAHYEQGPFECIDLTELYDFCLGNVIKYVWRQPFKGNPVEDLRKAEWYMDHTLNRNGRGHCMAPMWMSRKWLLLRKLEMINWVNAHDFWFMLRIGDLIGANNAIAQMIARERQAARES